MASELLMPSIFMMEGCGLSAIVFGLDNTIQYNKILIYLKNEKEKAIEVGIDYYDNLQTESATFDNLEKGKYYTVVADLYYADGTLKTIECQMPSKEVSGMGIALLSSSTGGSGGQPTGSEVDKPSKRPSLSSYRAITPIYTTIKDQGSYETCVANSLSTAMSIFKAKATSLQESYSVSYIYGSDRNSDIEFMYFEEAIQCCQDYGSPRWELYQGLQNDNMSKKNAVSKFIGAQGNTVVTNNAKKQKFDSYQWVNFYDCDTVADYIRNYGYFMFNFKIPNNFYDVSSNGIVPQPGGSDSYSGSNHSIALIGLTKINGVQYWIAQNSYGEWWGKNGICFIPLDWGYDSEEYWVLESYGITPGSDYDAEHPSVVSSLNAYQDEEGEKNVFISWNSNEAGAWYVILSRLKYTEKWSVEKIVTNGTFNTTCDVDDYGTYEFMVITMKNSYCSASVCVDNIFIGTESTILNPEISKISIVNKRVLIYYNSDCEDDDKTYTIYFKPSLSSDWQQKSGTSTLGIIDLPGILTSYDVKVKVMGSSSGYQYSNTLTLTTNYLGEPKPVKKIVAKRKYKSFELDWETDENSYGNLPSRYYIDFEKPGVDFIQFSTRDKHFIIDDEAIANEIAGLEEYYENFNEIEFGCTYKIIFTSMYITEYKIGDCEISEQYSVEDEYSLTSCPAPPQISCLSENQKIYINYDVTHETNASYFVFDLYDESRTNHLESITTYTVPSGSINFTNTYNDEKYYVVARTYYVVNGTAIGSMTPSEEEYVYAIVYISDGIFEWKQIYNHSNNTTGTISSTAYIPCDEDGLHPFTAAEWNRLVDAINRARTIARDKDINVTGNDLSHVSIGDDLVKAYKAAVQAIKNIEGYGSYLPSTYPVELSASLFTGLQSELNVVLRL